jgi:predicted NodU family carbamoyl transferase
MANRVLRDWTQSEIINELDHKAEVFFTRLIMKADDYGCFYGNYKLLSQSTSPDKFMYHTGKYTTFWGECSIGGMYTFFTMQLGFTPNADEGKVEALAAYGNHNNEVYTKLWNCFSVLYNSENYPYIQVNKEEAEMLFSLDEFKKMKQDFKKEDCIVFQFDENKQIFVALES